MGEKEVTRHFDCYSIFGSYRSDGSNRVKRRNLPNTPHLVAQHRVPNLASANVIFK